MTPEAFKALLAEMRKAKVLFCSVRLTNLNTNSKNVLEDRYGEYRHRGVCIYLDKPTVLEWRKGRVETLILHESAHFLDHALSPAGQIDPGVKLMDYFKLEEIKWPNAEQVLYHGPRFNEYKARLHNIWVLHNIKKTNPEGYAMLVKHGWA